jgi:hypothetical protein
LSDKECLDTRSKIINVIKGCKHQNVFPAEVKQRLLKDVLAFEPEALVSGMPVKIMWDA